MSVALRSFHKPVRLRLAVLAVHSYFDANADDNPTTTYSTMRTYSSSQTADELMSGLLRM
jgi:hypothetical protein